MAPGSDFLLCGCAGAALPFTDGPQDGAALPKLLKEKPRGEGGNWKRSAAVRGPAAPAAPLTWPRGLPHS